MRHILLLSLLFLVAHGVYAQTDTTIFNAMHKVETAEYILSVPNLWQNDPYLDNASKNRRFEFTGVALPREVNHTPVTAIFTLKKFECSQIKQADDYVLSEFTNYTDRITPPGFNYDRDTLTIASGETGDIFSTHFFRRTKASNYSRYDMVVYSTKRKAAYILTATFQYRDATYALENNAGFKKYMYRIFRGLVLR